MTTMDNKLYMFGGHHMSDTNASVVPTWKDVWSATASATTFTRVTSDALFSRSLANFVSLAHTLFVIGGTSNAWGNINFVPNFTPENTIYRSRDEGVTWALHATAPWTARYFATAFIL